MDQTDKAQERILMVGVRIYKVAISATNLVKI
jgi:hypothetical protein